MRSRSRLGLIGRQNCSCERLRRCCPDCLRSPVRRHRYPPGGYRAIHWHSPPLNEPIDREDPARRLERYRSGCCRSPVRHYAVDRRRAAFRVAGKRVDRDSGLLRCAVSAAAESSATSHGYRSPRDHRAVDDRRRLLSRRRVGTPRRSGRGHRRRWNLLFVASKRHDIGRPRTHRQYRTGLDCDSPDAAKPTALRRLLADGCD